MGRSLTVAVLNRAPATHSETTGSRARTPVEDEPKLSTGSTSTWKFPGRCALESTDSKKPGRVARGSEQRLRVCTRLQNHDRQGSRHLMAFFSSVLKRTSNHRLRPLTTTYLVMQD